jgi:hypothetical protein
MKITYGHWAGFFFAISLMGWGVGIWSHFSDSTSFSAILAVIGLLMALVITKVCED